MSNEPIMTNSKLLRHLSLDASAMSRMDDPSYVDAVCYILQQVVNSGLMIDLCQRVLEPLVAVGLGGQIAPRNSLISDRGGKPTVRIEMNCNVLDIIIYMTHDLEITVYLDNRSLLEPRIAQLQMTNDNSCFVMIDSKTKSGPMSTNEACMILIDHLEIQTPLSSAAIRNNTAVASHNQTLPTYEELLRILSNKQHVVHCIECPPIGENLTELKKWLLGLVGHAEKACMSNLSNIYLIYDQLAYNALRMIYPGLVSIYVNHVFAGQHEDVNSIIIEDDHHVTIFDYDSTAFTYSNAQIVLKTHTKQIHRYPPFGMQIQDDGLIVINGSRLSVHDPNSIATGREIINAYVTMSRLMPNDMAR